MVPRNVREDARNGVIAAAPSPIPSPVPFRFHVPAGSSARALARALPTLVLAALLPYAATVARAQTLNFTSVPEGYVAGSVPLPATFNNAIGVHPDRPREIYVSVGFFGGSMLARVDPVTGESAIVASGPFGNLGGIVPLDATHVVVADNHDVAEGVPGETILLLSDDDGDGDFEEPGEVRELIAPILTADFSGTQMRRLDPWWVSGMPYGSIGIQTADGAGGGEILVLVDPLGTPSFRPTDGAYYSGFDYNGGFDFDSRGDFYVGTLNGTSFTGEIHVIAESADGADTAGETARTSDTRVLIEGEGGMSDLVIDREDDILFAAPNASFVASVRTFRAPANPLADAVAPVDLAGTDSGFLTTLALDTKSEPFDPFDGPGATLYVGGLAGDFSSTTNLLTLTPAVGMNDSSLVASEVPAEALPSSSLAMRIEMRNTGTTTWSRTARHKLALLEDECGLWPTAYRRIDLPQGATTPPGETRSFGWWLVVPPGTAPADGQCTLRFRMVREQVEYYGEPVEATVTILEPPNAAVGWSDYE